MILLNGVYLGPALENIQFSGLCPMSSFYKPHHRTARKRCRCHFLTNSYFRSELCDIPDVTCIMTEGEEHLQPRKTNKDND